MIRSTAANARPRPPPAHQATEHDLWPLFSPVGEILELAILRSKGCSKGCAFLTYATEAEASTAISMFNARHMGYNKRLVVKFANARE